MNGLDLSAFLPPGALRVVHFGGDGTTRDRFLRIHPDCRYLQGGPGDDVNLWKAMEGPADCIVYEGEAAAALSAEVLAAHAAQLAPEGQVVVAMEHPGYIRRILALLEGRELPAPGGRFPSVVSSMAKAAGLFPDRIIPGFDSGDEEEKSRPATRQLLAAMEAWRKERGQDASSDPWACRYVMRFARKPFERLLLHAFLGEALVTCRVRLQEPGEFLATIPGVDYLAQTNADLSLAGRYPRKVFFFQRMRFLTVSNGLENIRRVCNRGYLAIGETDDNFTPWKKDHEASRYLEFRGMHALQVSTEALAELVRPFNPEVAVFRNELRELPPPREFIEGDAVTVFFGALNREQEWQDIMPAINEAIRDYGGRIRFRVLSDRAFYDALETEHKEFVGREDYYGGKYVPYEVYVNILRTADIALLPLHDTEFNRTKSDLKFIESAGHGAVVLDSPTVYRATVRDGRTGFLYHTPGEFAERLRFLVE
ncbi:MAG: hypothetical protein IJT01_12595, partial [Selenomonadaceae bacterium]|nr:hypothetical protein [Selenomonadaceae bacterium]